MLGSTPFAASNVNVPSAVKVTLVTFVLVSKLAPSSPGPPANAADDVLSPGTNTSGAITGPHPFGSTRIVNVSLVVCGNSAPLTAINSRLPGCNGAAIGCSKVSGNVTVESTPGVVRMIA